MGRPIQDSRTGVSAAHSLRVIRADAPVVAVPYCCSMRRFKVHTPNTVVTVDASAVPESYTPTVCVMERLEAEGFNPHKVNLLEPDMAWVVLDEIFYLRESFGTFPKQPYVLASDGASKKPLVWVASVPRPLRP